MSAMVLMQQDFPSHNNNHYNNNHYTNHHFSYSASILPTSQPYSVPPLKLTNLRDDSNIEHLQPKSLTSKPHSKWNPVHLLNRTPPTSPNNSPTNNNNKSFFKLHVWQRGRKSLSQQKQQPTKAQATVFFMETDRPIRVSSGSYDD